MVYSCNMNSLSSCWQLQKLIVTQMEKRAYFDTNPTTNIYNKFSMNRNQNPEVESVLSSFNISSEPNLCPAKTWGPSKNREIQRIPMENQAFNL